MTGISHILDEKYHPKEGNTFFGTLCSNQKKLQKIFSLGGLNDRRAQSAPPQG